MKGQIRIEFIFGIVVFALVIVLVVTLTNTLYSSLLRDSRKDVLKAKAINAIDILIEDTGDPPDWSTLPAASVKRVGLAYNQGLGQPYSLSVDKISALNASCGCGCWQNLLWNYNFSSYRIKIYNSTQQVLFCGYESLELPTVMETRYVYINGDLGNITLELW